MMAKNDADELVALITRSDEKLRDAQCTGNSRHTRIEACYDSIYLRMLVVVRAAGLPEPVQHASSSVIQLAGEFVGLNGATMSELYELHACVRDMRFSVGSHPVNLRATIALARDLAEDLRIECRPH